MQLLDGIPGLRCSATVNNAPQRGSFPAAQTLLVFKMSLHEFSEIRGPIRSCTLSRANANTTLRGSPADGRSSRSRKTRRPRARQEPRARCYFPLPSLFFARWLPTPKLVDLLQGRGKKKKRKRKKKQKRVDAHVCPGRPRRVAFFQVFRVKCSGGCQGK